LSRQQVEIEGEYCKGETVKPLISREWSRLANGDTLCLNYTQKERPSALDLGIL